MRASLLHEHEGTENQRGWHSSNHHQQENHRDILTSQFLNSFISRQWERCRMIHFVLQSLVNLAFYFRCRYPNSSWE